MDSNTTCYLVLNTDLAQSLHNNDNYCHSLGVLPQSLENLNSQQTDQQAPVSVVEETIRLNSLDWIETKFWVESSGNEKDSVDFMGYVQSFQPDIKFKQSSVKVDLIALKHVVQKAQKRKAWFIDGDAISV